MLRQQRNVAGALPQRRQADGDDAEAVKEVFPKGAALDGLAQVPVGGGDDADVQLDALLAAHLHELPLLDHPEELGLDVEAEIGDLVEEKGAVIGQFEEAVLGLVGPGKGALDVAEEFAFQQGLHQGGAVHRHEFLVPRGG